MQCSPNGHAATACSSHLIVNPIRHVDEQGTYESRGVQQSQSTKSRECHEGMTLCLQESAVQLAVLELHMQLLDFQYLSLQSSRSLA